MKEQVDMGGHGLANLERGINTLSVDQPGTGEALRMPFLVTHGENNRQIPVANAHRSYEQAVDSAKRHLRIFTAADFEVEHCGADNGTGMRDYVADWCAETFAEVG